MSSILTKSCLNALRQNNNQALNIFKYNQISTTEKNETTKSSPEARNPEIGEFLTKKSIHFNNGWTSYNLAMCQNTMIDMGMKVNMKDGNLATR